MKLLDDLKEKLSLSSSNDSSLLNIKKARAAFPSLADGYIFADNAGGSQCLKSVADKVSDYLLNSNVQLGASSISSRRHQ